MREAATRKREGGIAPALRALAWGLAALALAVFAWESWLPVPQLDDAYISYRYAEHLANGRGLVYNPGEYVEGFTNLLWTLMVAAGVSYGFAAPGVGHALGVASGAATLVVTAAWAARTHDGACPQCAAGAAWIVLAHVGFAVWVTSGLETPLFALLATGALAAHAQGRIALATAMLVLASLTRPEGVLLAAVVHGWHVVSRLRTEGLRALAWPAIYALFLVLLTAWRMAYYGSPLPNTFYAKVGGVPFSRGLAYAMGFFAGGVWLLVYPAAVALRDPRLRPAAAWIALMTLYVIAVGGDVFPYSRFFVPVLPALAVLATSGAQQLARRSRAAGALCWGSLAVFVLWSGFGRFVWSVAACAAGVAALALAGEWAAHRRPPRLRAVAAAAAGVLAVFAWGPRPHEQVAGLPGRRTRADALASAHAGNARFETLGRDRARLLDERGERGALVAVGAIGALGYHAPVRVLDLFGLVDPHIAHTEPGPPGLLTLPGHQRSDADYVLSREPDYILIPQRGAEVLVTPAMLALWSHPGFAAHYVWDPPMRGYRRIRDAAPPQRAE